MMTSLYDGFISILNASNDFIWTYVMVVALLCCAVWFTWRTHFVQFRLAGEMFRLLGDSTSKEGDSDDSAKHISSFQAFMISLASRVGVGNLAGVATAIVIGGPGAIFWMWLIALLGAATAFVESTLAQLYKVRGEHSFIGGPAYYISKGLNKQWMARLFAVLIIITFGFAFNSVQSNTICAALSASFQWDNALVGVVITALTMIIIFGGVQRIAKVNSIVVPLMALAYLVLALYVVLTNLNAVPGMFRMILANAFGWEQGLGGGVGAALMMGIKRGLFSNEAGEGSTPNAAATAIVSHPVKQGLIQALGVFTDTLFICTCTAFIILLSSAHIEGLNGIQVTQMALEQEVGPLGSTFVAIAVIFFAFTSILGNYYYGEANLQFLTRRRFVIVGYRILVGAIVMFGALTSLDLVWAFADLTMAAMTTCNLIAIVLLGKQAFKLLDHYWGQKRAGIKSPTFKKSDVGDVPGQVDCWGE